jgi:hypothetical protein
LNKLCIYFPEFRSTMEPIFFLCIFHTHVARNPITTCPGTKRSCRGSHIQSFFFDLIHLCIRH